eukprot:CAMPEP_0118987974 /NCGR_PEP_ID=MMETSP1173-20130426/45304_1 /TAXON_ID=1034831 /ORGANISM="Rhizochromulina marina cf, Strain CCMP1243" /LENGTH=58 /DNA_ID=CAMNT_0006938873 /DNA_START=467 /DNA_END=643 /DNA_ORIENTATION=+
MVFTWTAPSPSSMSKLVPLRHWTILLSSQTSTAMLRTLVVYVTTLSTSESSESLMMNS